MGISRAAQLFCGLIIVLLLGCDTRDTQVSESGDNANAAQAGCWFDVSAYDNVECGYYQPQDVPQFQLAYVVIKHNPLQRSDTAVLYLPGGPGGDSFLSQEGIDHWRDWYARANVTADLVLVDRRGVGQSTPSWHCDDYIDFSRQVLKQDLSGLEEAQLGFDVIAQCLQQLEAQGFDGLAFSTSQSASDILGVLRANHYSSWHVFGVSYGTRLALAIYEAAPTHVRSLVLDSLYAPNQGLLTDWPPVLSGALSRLWASCEAFSHCESPATLEAAFWKVLDNLKQAPVSVVVPSWNHDAPYEVLVNDQRFVSIVFSSLYDRYAYPDIVDAIVELTGYRKKALARLVEPFINYAFDPNFNDMVFFAVECRDNPMVSPEQYQSAVSLYPAWKAYTEFSFDYDICPLLNPGGVIAPFSLADDVMPVVDVPVLLMGGELDPVTPLSWAKLALPYLPQGQTVFLPNYGHAIESSLPCGAEVVGRFINNPTAKVAVDCLEDQW